MGMDVGDEVVDTMMKDASQPMDFDSFAMMMCFKTMEMEPEIVLLEALSKWDERIQGVISLERFVYAARDYDMLLALFTSLEHLTFFRLKEQATRDFPSIIYSFSMRC